MKSLIIGTQSEPQSGELLLDLFKRLFAQIANLHHVLLVQRNQEDMMKVRNLGKKSLEEVEQKLAALGLALRANDE